MRDGREAEEEAWELWGLERRIFQSRLVDRLERNVVAMWMWPIKRNMHRESAPMMEGEFLMMEVVLRKNKHVVQ